MDKRIHLQQGDIIKSTTDAIINAANFSLLGGGGVDGAIHRARQGGCEVGEAVITTGGNLPAKYVIHTVGPVWNGGKNNEEQLLANAYRNSLILAVQNDIKTIAFPNMSTGIYHFPKDKAVAIAVNMVTEFLAGNDQLTEVVFVCFDQENYQLYQEILNK